MMTKGASEPFVSVARIGGHMMALSLGWLREHWPEAPWFETEHDAACVPYTEDYRFCDMARLRGGRIVCAAAWPAQNGNVVP